uniref:DUF6420 family protein n=1 Tax=Streptomyces sp. CHD11 TaxID=2741325 RepID=UPI0034D66A5E
MKDRTTAENRGVAGPYSEYDGLPLLHGRESGLPLARPHGLLDAERSLTPGGGRLTVQRTAAHHRTTLDGTSTASTAPCSRKRPSQSRPASARGLPATVADGPLQAVRP